MNPIISPTDQNWLATAQGAPTTYAPSLTPLTQNAAPATPTAPTAPRASAAPGGAGGGGQYDGYWNTQNDLINHQLSRLPGQEVTGRQNLLDAYGKAYQQLTNDKSYAEAGYNNSRNNTIQDNILAKENIDNGVHDQLTGLQRLLGASGAGNSSAAQILAPYAAGREGDIQRGQVQHTYGRNLGALDTGWGETQNQFTNSFGQLNEDKANKLSDFLSGMKNTKAGLLGQQDVIKARLNQPIDPANVQQIKELGTQVDALGAKQTFTPAPVNAKPVDLAQYNYTKFNAPSAGSNVDPTLAQNVGAYWNLLTGRQKANPVGA